MTPTYEQLYNDLTEATGTTPGSVLAAELEQHYQRHPAAFAANTRSTLDGWAAGRITSPWAFLRSTMRKLEQHRPVPEAAGPERDTAIRLAETWIRNAGLHAPLDQALDELYGDRGRLRPWQDDHALHTRIVALWHNQQPRIA